MSTTAQGKAFERRVGHLFGLSGYRVEHDVLISGRQIDLLIEDNTGLLSRQYIVECKDQSAPVNTEQYDAFRGRLMSARREISPKLRGIIVASVGFVKEVKAQSQNEDIELLTISDLETNLIDFRHYVRSLIANLSSDEGLKYFVDPRIVRDQSTVPEAALPVFERWLADPEANQLTLLGDYGTGKTTLLRKVSLDVAKRYEEEVVKTGARGRVPIFVDLRDYTQAISFRQVILDVLDRHRIRTASFDAFEYVSREGQLLLILDGFDEMATRGNYHTTLRNFRELNRQALGRAKIILSCRTHYFTDAQQEERYLRPQAAAAVTELYREIATRRNFSIAYLQEFDADQVTTYITNRCGAGAAPILNFIRDTYDLTGLSRRPVLLEMIVSSAAALAARRDPVSAGILYDAYTNIWLSKNDWSTLLDVKSKTELLENFAQKAWTRPDYQIRFDSIPLLISSWKPGFDDVEREEIDRDLRTASFLVRDHSGNYRFSHQSFLEYFYARYLVTQAARDNVAAWQGAQLRTEVYRFIQDLVNSNRSAVDRLRAWMTDEAIPLTVRGYAIKCLSRIPDRTVERELLAILSSETDDALRQYAASALSHSRDDHVATILAKYVNTGYEDAWVRANALMALSRMRTPRAIQIVLGMLEKQEEVRQWPLRMVHLFCRTLSDAPDEIVDAFLAGALEQLPGTHSRNTIRDVIAVCIARPSSRAIDFCERVVTQDHSVGAVVRAFAGLPVKRKRVHLESMLSILATRMPNDLMELLVRSLKGIRDDKIGSSLVELVSTASLPVRVAALEVIIADYRDLLEKHAPDWWKRKQSNPLSIRLLAIESFIANRPPDGPAHLRDLLLHQERTVMKVTALNLLRTHYRDAYFETIDGIWSENAATPARARALEYAMQIDAAKAMELALCHGVNGNRPGLRVTSCALLAGDARPIATDALLLRLRSDSSKWVRAQALRSLVSPGRKVQRDQIFSALGGERDETVLTLRRQLLGE